MDRESGINHPGEFRNSPRPWILLRVTRRMLHATGWTIIIGPVASSGENDRLVRSLFRESVRVTAVFGIDCYFIYLRCITIVIRWGGLILKMEFVLVSDVWLFAYRENRFWRIDWVFGIYVLWVFSLLVPRFLFLRLWYSLFNGIHY